MENSLKWKQLLDEQVGVMRKGIDTCLLRLSSGRTWSLRDCAAYEYVWKKLLYSDDPVISQIRNILPLTCLPVAKQHPESGQSAVFGKVDACLCKLLSHSTKAVLRKGELMLTVPPEDLMDELLFCYLRYLVFRRPKIEIPQYVENMSLM